MVNSLSDFSRRGLWFLALCVGALVGCSESQQVAEEASPGHQPLRHVVRKEPLPKSRPSTSDTARADDWQPTVFHDTVPTKEGGILAPDLLDNDEVAVPPVVMSEQHALTCLARVGDQLPNARLPDLAGRENDLSKLRGRQLTIVFFFSPGDRHSLDELGMLARDVASPLAVRGVKVVGICEHSSAAAAQRACDKAGVSFPVLSDPGSKYFERVATDHLSRTYLLDATGRIVWFDIEYGRATRRDLREALRALL